MKYIGAFIACVFFSSCSQILLKHSAVKGYKGIKTYLNFETLLGYGIMFLAMFGATILYKHIDLSVGTVLDSLGYVFVLVLSMLILKEKISVGQIKGMVLIMLGTVICCLS